MNSDSRDSAPRRSVGRRVFLGPEEIAGYYAGLERALRASGVDALLVDLYGHPFQYARAADRRLPLVARPAAAARAVLARRRSRLGRAVWKGIAGATRVPTLVWALLRFDVFVFGYRRSLFGLRELPLLRRLGKRVVFVFHGSDARPPYLDGSDMHESEGLTIAECVALAARKKRELRWIERYADVVICHPLYAHFLERPYVRWSALGMPYELAAGSTPEARRPSGQAPRVLHSPSNPAVKGTARIRSAVANVVASGVALDYAELSGVPNAVVLREIGESDFVIDQALSDVPMATFATEAAWQARPAVVGSYGWDELERELPAEERPPVQACHPDDIEAAIRLLATDPEAAAALGRAANRYVVDHWNDRQFGERYLRVLTGEVPQAWLSRPSTIRYRFGCGLPAARARAITGEIVARYGPAALQLGDKPELEAALVTWATADSG
jgi:hypothetical protein